MREGRLHGRARLSWAVLFLLGLAISAHRAHPAHPAAVRRTTANSAASGTGASTLQAAQPNLLFILTDDLDTSSLAFMPHIAELLAAQGVSFDEFFVNNSLCCPSRSTILRGQYLHSHKVLTNHPPEGGFERFHSLGLEDSTLATWLHAGGYRTALMGKYLNDYPATAEPTYVPPGWDEWYSPAEGTPYSEFDYKLNENGALVSYGHQAGDYMTDVLAGKAAEFIRRRTGQSQPFFLYLATYAPHAPATPAPRDENGFPDARAPRVPSFNEPDISDKPGWILRLPLLDREEIKETDDLARKRLQSMLAVDEMVGTLVDALGAAGKLDNTYIVFTSDNGFHLGVHRLLPGKQTAYEEDIRVPLIVRGPRIPAGAVVDDLCGNVDLAPTFMDLASLEPPAFVEGRSLAPLLFAAGSGVSAAPWRQAYLLEHVRNMSESRRREVLEYHDPSDLAAGRAGQPVIVPSFTGLRTKDYLFVQYRDGEREMYDLRADPYELQNIAGTAPADLVSGLSSWLARMKVCSATGCLEEEQSAPAVLLGGAGGA